MSDRVRDVEYRAFFVLGVCLLSRGVTLVTTLGGSAIAFLGCGVTFMALGLANRGRWPRVETKRLDRDDA